MNISVEAHTSAKESPIVGAKSHTVRRRKPERPNTGRAEQKLSETNFMRTFRKIDTTAKSMIAEATKASGNVRRASAQIVVEGVRLLKASESAPNDWQSLIKRELTDCGIKINRGEIYECRVVANLLFRGITKVKNDADLADSKISRGQITRYAQAMAWSYEKHQAGTALKLLADEIVALGGVRSVADSWAKAQRFRKEKARSTADAELPSESDEGGVTDLPTARPALARVSLPIIGTAKLKEAIPLPLVCLIYPDGKVRRAPLTAETMTAMVAQWEVSQ